MSSNLTPVSKFAPLPQGASPMYIEPIYMTDRKSARRIQMGEEMWAEYQQERIKKKSTTQTLKDKASRKVTRYRRAMKAKLIEYKGGACNKCGYDKPFPSAYHFHHRDPRTKSFNLSARGCTLRFETLREEVDKCDLLCANCHAELHDIEYQNNEFMQGDKLKERTLRRPNESWEQLCERCLKPFQTIYPSQRYCHPLCRSRHRDEKYALLKTNTPIKSVSEPKKYDSKWRSGPKLDRRKVVNRPSADELQQMLTNMSWCAIGRQYGVSDNAIRKWAKGYGILA